MYEEVCSRAITCSCSRRVITGRCYEPTSAVDTCDMTLVLLLLQIHITNNFCRFTSGWKIWLASRRSWQCRSMAPVTREGTFCSPRYVNKLHVGPDLSVCGALMFSFICAWTNGWINNRDDGDLRRHRAHCDVIVMIFFTVKFITIMTTCRIIVLLFKSVQFSPNKFLL